MKKNYFYYFLAISLVLHALLIAFVRLEEPERKKEKAPITIDWLGPSKEGPETQLPKMPAGTGGPSSPSNESRRNFARSFDHLRPTLPQIAVPPRPVRQPEPTTQPAPAQSSPGDAFASRPPAAQPPPSTQTMPDNSGGIPPTTDSKDIRAPKQRKFQRPTLQDLEKYAQLDKDAQRQKDEDSAVVDPLDLRFTSYLLGFKRRTEHMMKVPEAAAKDGIEGIPVIRVTINKSGSVDSAELIKSSGYKILDDAARKALMDASPYNPLPDNLKLEKAVIYCIFYYTGYGTYLRY
ncbi:MAG TPA: TonB family protein [Nitrospirota bacterium]|jgi:TonB family protein